MVLRGWGARVCAVRKSRTRAREQGRDSRPRDRWLVRIAGASPLPPPPLSRPCAAHRSIRLLCVFSDDSRYEGFLSLLQGVALGEPVVCEAVAIRSIRTGSLVKFSTNEVERHLQRVVEECRIMRSRGNIYFM